MTSRHTFITYVNVASIFCQIPLGMAQAANVRIGNELGAGNVTSAKRVACLAMGFQSKYKMCSIDCFY